jgi:hypothetical protein
MEHKITITQQGRTAFTVACTCNFDGDGPIKAYSMPDAVRQAEYHIAGERMKEKAKKVP